MKDPSMIHSISTRETVESSAVNKYRSIPRQRLLMTKRRLTKLTVTKVRLTRHSSRYIVSVPACASVARDEP